MKIIYISHLRIPSEKIQSLYAMKTCEGLTLLEVRLGAAYL